MSKKLAVGIPTYNRYDLLEPILPKYALDFPGIRMYIVDNGRQGVRSDQAIVIENESNVGVGASWNQLCRTIFENHEYALILNDDIYLGRGYEDVIDLVERKKGFVRATPDWCAFAMSKGVYEKVGPFDECFMPAYYEDKSYERRMRLLGLPVNTHPRLNPIIYRSSQSLERDHSILDQAKRNKRLYIDMWGGEPGKEKFSQPFNNYKKNKNEVL